MKLNPIWPDNDFKWPVQLQALDEPNNVSFSPFSYIGDNYGAPINASTMRITIPANATIGRHVLRVRGTSQNGEQRDASVAVDVLGSQNVSTLSISPNYAVSTPNNPATATVTIYRATCSDPVTLSALGYGGGTAVFSPNPVPGTSTISTLTMPFTASYSYQPTIIRIISNQCNLANSQTYLTVMDLPAQTGGHFLIVPTQPQFKIIQGESTSFDINLLRFGGFQQSVNFTAQNNLPGVTVTFSPASTTASVTTLTYTASPNISGGDIKVIGTTASGDTSSFTANVRGTAGFSPCFNIVPQTYTNVLRGGSAKNILNIQRKDFTGAIDLVVFASTIPGITTSFSDPSPTGNHSELTISVAQSVPPGQYVMTVQGNVGGTQLLNYANFLLVVI